MVSLDGCDALMEMECCNPRILWVSLAVGNIILFMTFEIAASIILPSSTILAPKQSISDEIFMFRFSENVK